MSQAPHQNDDPRDIDRGPVDDAARAQPQRTNDAGGESPTMRAEAEAERLEEAVAALIESDAPAEQLAIAVEELDAADAAEALQSLDPEQTAEVIQEMEEETAAEALAHMDAHLAATVLLDLDDREAAEFIDLMEPDDAADVLQALPRERAAAILRQCHPRTAAKVGKLALYDPETAGGMMTADILVVSESVTIDRAIDFVKRHQLQPAQRDIYVVDRERRFVGTIDLRTLLIAEGGDRVADHTTREVDALKPTDDREEVADLFRKYDYLTLPVLDDGGRILGMVTIDDVVDTIQAEATEDVLKQVGAGAKESVHSSVPDKLRGRFPWLMVNLVTSQLAASIVLFYHDLIEAIPIAAAIYPVIANQAGNAGQQSLAVTLRGIVLGEVRSERVRRLLFREMMVGVIAGFAVGTVLAFSISVLGWLGLVEGFDPRMGLIAGIAMTGALWVGCLVGTSIPLVMDKIGIDPATAASIFLTMLTDSISFATFLTLLMLLHDHAL